MAAARTPQDRKPAAKKAASVDPQKLRAGSRSAARKSAAPSSSPVTSDGLAAEASGEEPVRPDGMPDLRPLFELPRRVRAQYLRAVDRMTMSIRGNAELVALEGASEEEASARIASSPSMLTVTADLAEMAADIEDALVLVAVDPVVFAAWAAKAPDEALTQAFAFYQTASQPGEA